MGVVTDFAISQRKQGSNRDDFGFTRLKIPAWALTVPARAREIVNDLI
jgi:hypothetical protein